MELRTIYAHIFPDKSIYIGSTGKKNLNLRWGYNGSGYDKQEEVRERISFWGWGLVEHVILEQGEMTKEESLKKECDYTLQYVKEGYTVLNKYNTKDPCRYRVKEVKRVYEYVDVVSGKVYDTLREAAEDIGVSHETVRLSIIEQRGICRGKHRFEKRIKKININIEMEEEENEN